jgi:FO synthase
VQEVIIQNFLPKLLTGMRNAPACPPDEYLWTIAAARLVLPPSIHLQAPPNLSDDFGVLLDAGIDDWGGVSPVTADHVNPERPWPDLDRLREVTEARGFTLAPRLTAYPEYLDDSLAGPEHWIDPALRFAVLDRSDAEALARDDPGSQFPERVQGTTETADGADVVIVGDRSTQWYSGWNANPPTLLPAPSGPIRGAVAEVLDGFEAGADLGIDEMVTLFEARGREVAAVAEAADRLRRETVGDRVTWVHNRNINYTNVCTFKCKFCGFAKGKISLNLRGTPYLLTIEDIQQRVREAWELGATEVTLQGGIHPELRRRLLHRRLPRREGRRAGDARACVHRAGSARGREATRRTVGELPAAAAGSRPAVAARHGRGDPRRRAALDPVPRQGDDRGVARGARDRAPDRAALERHDHGRLDRTPDPLGPSHRAHPRRAAAHRRLHRVHPAAVRAHGVTDLPAAQGPPRADVPRDDPAARRRPPRLPGLIDNVQASWVKIGVPGVRQLLQAGVNDLGGTLMDENISRAAGAIHGQKMTEEAFGSLVAPLGRTLARRTTLYDLPEPVMR